MRYATVCLLTIAFCMGLRADAQRDSIRRYLDGHYRLSNRANGLFGGMQIRNEAGWTFFALYPDTTLLIQMSFKDKDLRIKDGPFAVYFRGHGPWQTGTYSNNQADGEWRTWYTNRQLKQMGTLKLGVRVGVWQTWYESGQLESAISYTTPDTVLPASTLSDQMADEGGLIDFPVTNGDMSSRTTWYPSGTKESEAHFAKGQLEGYSYWYYNNGQPATRELYKNGKLESLECYNDSGRLTGSTCSILKAPVFVHPFFNALDYIEYELHKDKKKDTYVEGYVNTEFVVTSGGKVSALVIAGSPDPRLTEAIRSIFKQMPDWSPAIVHNRAIDYKMKITIPYFRGSN